MELCLLKCKENFPKSEFNEFESRLKSAKNRFQLSTGLKLETNLFLSRGLHLGRRSHF